MEIIAVDFQAEAIAYVITDHKPDGTVTLLDFGAIPNKTQQRGEFTLEPIEWEAIKDACH